jgi:DNA-directed RNA polymerase specialized sigma24 family protein
MDEVRRFCVRMLGDGSAARDAEQQALAHAGA